VHGKETSHFYPTRKAHICYNATASFGPIPETRVPLMLVFPSPLWNILKVVIDNMKEALSSVKDHHWINQSKCGTARQYLKELATSKSLKKVHDQAMAVIQPFKACCTSDDANQWSEGTLGIQVRPEAEKLYWKI
jgi:hypothetical protein